MKQEISALMDGELFEDEADVLLSRLKQDPTVRKNWSAYHLIGDVLRQPDHIHNDLSAEVGEKLRDEPTVFAPQGKALNQRVRAIAMSAVASVSAIGLVVWMSVQVSDEALLSPGTLQKNSLRPVAAQIQPKSNDYLMAHQEFSPSTDMSGGAYYMRTVTFRSDSTQAKGQAGTE